MARPDMSRINLLLLIGIAILVAIFSAARFCPITLPIPHHKQVSQGLYGVAAVFAMLTLLQHGRRVATPWKTSAASVSVTYILFFIFSLAGILVYRLGV